MVLQLEALSVSFLTTQSHFYSESSPGAHQIYFQGTAILDFLPEIPITFRVPIYLPYDLTRS